MLGRSGDQPRFQFWAGALARLAQARAERLHARMRADLFKSDEWLGDAIAFAGERE
jgi:hypothetical protein